MQMLTLGGFQFRIKASNLQDWGGKAQIAMGTFQHGF